MCRKLSKHEGVLSETTVQASQIGETGSVVQERCIRPREMRVLEEPIFKLQFKGTGSSDGSEVGEQAVH